MSNLLSPKSVICAIVLIRLIVNVKAAGGTALIHSEHNRIVGFGEGMQYSSRQDIDILRNKTTLALEMPKFCEEKRHSHSSKSYPTRRKQRRIYMIYNS